MTGYKSLDDAYHEGLNAFANGEPNNLWSPYATEDEAAMWRHGWNDGAGMERAEKAWAKETEEVSRRYRYLDEPKEESGAW